MPYGWDMRVEKHCLYTEVGDQGLFSGAQQVHSIIFEVACSRGPLSKIPLQILKQRFFWLHFSQVDILYSGADDCKFKGWDSREGCERPALFCNQKEHGAGVCCIASNPHKQHHVISGSYDEYARYWDIRNLSKPLLQCKV